MYITQKSLQPGARFSNSPETFWARKAIFSSSVSKYGEMCTPETSCMKGTSHICGSNWLLDYVDKTAL